MAEQQPRKKQLGVWGSRLNVLRLITTGGVDPRLLFSAEQGDVLTDVGVDIRPLQPDESWGTNVLGNVPNVPSLDEFLRPGENPGGKWAVVSAVKADLREHVSRIGGQAAIGYGTSDGTWTAVLPAEGEPFTESQPDGFDRIHVQGALALGPLATHVAIGSFGVVVDSSKGITTIFRPMDTVLHDIVSPLDSGQPLPAVALYAPRVHPGSLQ